MTQSLHSGISIQSVCENFAKKEKKKTLCMEISLYIKISKRI